MASRIDRLKGTVDLYFTEAGDFYLSPQGDLEDTKLDYYRGFLQRLDTRIMSAKGDWATQQQVGVGLTDFVGKRNTADLGRAIKSRVYSELIRDDLLRPAEFTVDVIPVTATKLAISVIVQPPGSTGTLTRLYTYSTLDNKVYGRGV